MGDPTAVRIRDKPWLTMVKLYATVALFAFFFAVIEAHNPKNTPNKAAVSKDEAGSRKERHTGSTALLESRAQEETARLQVNAINIITHLVLTICVKGPIDYTDS